MVLWRSASGGLRCPLPLVSVAALQLVPVLGKSHISLKGIAQQEGGGSLQSHKGPRGLFVLC